MNFIKKFIFWNLLKQKIHIERINKKYHAGDIWWCNIGQNIGFEQNGANDNFDRPVLVIKGFNKSVCLIVPLTSKIKKNKFHYEVGLVENKIAYAILSQIRLIDTKRFTNQIGFLHSFELKKIKKAIWDLIR